MEEEHECAYKLEVQELRAQLSALLIRFAEMEIKLAECQAKLAKYEGPPKNSNNSSKPPSQDQNRRHYPKREKSNRKTGGQEGHHGYFHPLTENPDEIVLLHAEICPYCNSQDLEGLDEYSGEVRQEIEVPALKPHIREYRLCASRCRHCGEKSRGRFPEQIKAPVQMGNSIDSLVGYLKVQLHLSHEKINHLCEDLLNLHLSEGSIQNSLKRLAENHESSYNALKESLKKVPVAHSDETGNRINGQKGYVWVFVSTLLCVFVSHASRGFEVIQDFFGESFPTVWVSDRYNAQLKVNALHQLCLAHLIRECRYLIDAEQSQWAMALKSLFQESITFRNQQGETFEPFSRNTFRPILEFEKRLSQLLSRPPSTPREKKLFKGLFGRQQQLLLFLRDPNVPPTNNEAERALRNRVVHRKITGCFRTQAGSHYHDIIASLIETAKRQGKSILQVLSQKESLLLRS